MFSRDARITGSQDAMCGAVSGVAARTMTAPLDVTKVMFQVGVPNANRHAYLGGGTFHLMQHISHTETVRGLFKGNLTSCVKMFPATIIQFATYMSLRAFICGDSGQLTLPQLLGISAAAGYTSTVLTYPLDTVKTRLIAQSSHPRDRAYTGILDCLHHVRSAEPPWALWRGLSAALIGITFFGMVLTPKFNFCVPVTSRDRILFF